MDEQLRQNQMIEIPLDDKGFLDLNQVSIQVQIYRKEKSYSQALNYLNHIKNNISIQSRDAMIKMHDFYIDILLDIEDYPSLLNILTSKEKYLNEQKALNTHRFYLAICYEGLNDISKAIEALESIEDILSRKNLTNKYIKLAILYAEKNDVQKAKLALEHAEVFDREKQNDMFLLAQSDILFKEGSLYKAMQVYEDFFIKSKRQLSYLNRFIKISMALERISDAFDFYHRYKEKVMETSSIQAKIAFFEAALSVLKMVNQADYIEANDYLESIYHRTIIDFDDFSYYQFLLKYSQNKKIYSEEREVIRDFFIDLDTSSVFIKLAIVKLSHAHLKVLHFTKNLLLEKDYQSDHQITQDLISHKTKQTYQKNEIEGFIFVQDNIDYLFIEMINPETYFLGYIAEKDFDIAKKLALLAKGLLAEKINHVELLNVYQHLDQGYQALLDERNIGLLKIHQNQLMLLNQSAHALLGIDKSFMSFKSFQSQLEPMIYLDEFSSKTSFDVSFNEKQLVMTSKSVGLDIYLLVEKPIEEIKEAWMPDRSLAMVVIDIINHDQIKKQFGYSQYMEQFNSLREELPKATNYHLKDLLIESDHLFIVLLDTRDKRIFERLDKKLYVEGYDIRMAYHHFNHSYQDTLAKLFELLSYTDHSNPFISGDLPLRKAFESRKIYLETVQHLINSKICHLKHAYIKNWQSQKVEMIDVSFSDLKILSDKSKLDFVLKSNDLEILFDRLIVNQLIKDAKVYDVSVPFIVEISVASVKDKKAYHYLLRRLETIKQHKIYFKMTFENYFSLSKNDQNYLLEKETPLMLYGDVYDISKIKALAHHDLLMIEPDIFDSDLSDIWIQLLQQRFHTIIYNHHHEQLLRKDLERLNILLVKGAFAGEKEII